MALDCSNRLFFRHTEAKTESKSSIILYSKTTGTSQIADFGNFDANLSVNSGQSRVKKAAAGSYQ